MRPRTPDQLRVCQTAKKWRLCERSARRIIELLEAPTPFPGHLPATAQPTRGTAGATGSATRLCASRSSQADTLDNRFGSNKL